MNKNIPICSPSGIIQINQSNKSITQLHSKRNFQIVVMELLTWHCGQCSGDFLLEEVRINYSPYFLPSAH